MAPPPASGPLTQRLTHLAQTLQFYWFLGHLTLLFCAFRYGLSYFTLNYYSKTAILTYRTAFLAAPATYGIVVYKAHRARARAGTKPPGGALGLLADENVQYLIMALVWLYSRQVPLALLPFMVYSIFHVATYTRSTLIPTVYPPQQGVAGSGSALGDTIGKFIKEHYDTSMTIVAYLEIGLWCRLLLGAFTFAKGTWVLFGIYTLFFRARYSQSTFVQGAINGLVARVDATLANQSTPPAARQAWDTVKGFARQATDATDVNKYVSSPGAPGAGPKKAQ
ncbi:MAG: hypothetical protein M1819_004685 [Sarea resinae]|nr:MAG: hypothetical protein M1819_004685 [Sarea resinae]